MTSNASPIARFERADSYRWAVLKMFAAYSVHVRKYPRAGDSVRTPRPQHADSITVVERDGVWPGFEPHLAGPSTEVFNVRLAPIVIGQRTELEFLDSLGAEPC